VIARAPAPGPHGSESRAVRVLGVEVRWTPRRLLVLGAASLAYTIVFVALYRRLGDVAVAAAVLPIAAAGWWLRVLLVRVRTQARILADERADLQGQIARRIEVEAKLRSANVLISEARDRALAGARAKSAFLANMSHELRTPLTSIIGYAELMIEDAADPPPAGAARVDPVKDVHKIVEAGRYLLGLIDDLLDLSRIEAGKLPLQIAPVDVEKVARSALDAVRPAAAARGTTLALEVEPNLPPMRSDATRLRQILLNVAGSAVRVTEKGKVTLAVARDSARTGDWYVFRLSDTGAGMPPEERAQLISEFYEGPPVDRRDQRATGAGLGLAITRRLCELLGGEIGIESEPGEGATLTIVLPQEPPRSATSG